MKGSQKLPTQPKMRADGSSTASSDQKQFLRSRAFAITLMVFSQIGCDYAVNETLGLECVGTSGTSRLTRGLTPNLRFVLQNPDDFRQTTGRLVIKISDDLAFSDIKPLLDDYDLQQVKQLDSIGVLVADPMPGDDVAQIAADLRSDEAIEWVELEKVHREQAASPNDPWYFGQWHLDRIGSLDAWDYTEGDAQIVIAICDSGVDASHPDLVGKLVPGFNVSAGNTDTSDVTGHGTAVAGLAAAATNNSEGIAAVAPNCMIMPIRVGNETGATSSALIAEGLIWAADHGARVANVSYGILGSQVVSTSVQYFNDMGGVVVTSAGNEGVYIDYPNDDEVITVGATTSSDAFALFSNSGPFIDVLAPGAGLFTTSNNGNYSAATGTSFASPLVAGVAALVLSANPDLTSEEVRHIIATTASSISVTPEIPMSVGMVHALAAVERAMGVTTEQPDTQPPSSSVIIPADGDVVTGSVDMLAAAVDDTGISSVAILLDGVEISSSGFAPFFLQWDSHTVENGTYEMTVRATDVAGNAADSQSILIHVRNTDSGHRIGGIDLLGPLPQGPDKTTGLPGSSQSGTSGCRTAPLRIP